MSECQASPGAREMCERLADEMPEIKCPCGRAPGRVPSTSEGEGA